MGENIENKNQTLSLPLIYVLHEQQFLSCFPTSVKNYISFDLNHNRSSLTIHTIKNHHISKDKGREKSKSQPPKKYVKSIMLLTKPSSKLLPKKRFYIYAFIAIWGLLD
jgi:hypothetical protein